MRSLIVILIFLIFGVGIINAQTSDSAISDIRKEYQVIRQNLSTYDTTIISLLVESTERGQGVAYWDATKIKLIEVVWWGEMGKRKVQYYFDGGQLFFAISRDYEYNRPIYWDEERAKEIGDKASFDEKKTEIRENRFYFQDGKLIRWINENNKEENIDSPAATKKESELKEHADEIKAKTKT